MNVCLFVTEILQGYILHLGGLRTRKLGQSPPLQWPLPLGQSFPNITTLVLSGTQLVGLWSIKSQGTGRHWTLALWTAKYPSVTDWTLPHFTPVPHQPIMLTNGTIELVRTLSQSETTSPGLTMFAVHEFCSFNIWGIATFIQNWITKPIEILIEVKSTKIFGQY